MSPPDINENMVLSMLNSVQFFCSKCANFLTPGRLPPLSPLLDLAVLTTAEGAATSENHVSGVILKHKYNII